MSKGAPTVAVTVAVGRIVAAATASSEHGESSTVLDHSGRVRALAVVLVIDPLGLRDLKVLRLLLVLLVLRLSELSVELRLPLDRVGL